MASATDTIPGRYIIALTLISESKANLGRIDFTRPLVTVLVGKQVFTFNKDCLCESSHFFNSAFSHGWLEREQKSVCLQDHELETFAIYANWKYTKKVELSKEGKKLATCVDDGENGGRWKEFVKCYVLGDMIGDRKFRNAMIDCYFTLCKETSTIPSRYTNDIFNSVPHLKLFQLLVDGLAFSLDIEDYAARHESFVQEVHKAVALVSVKEQRLDRKEKQFTAKGKGPCYYHEHVDGEGKCV